MMLGAPCAITCTPEAPHPKTLISHLELCGLMIQCPQGNNLTLKSLKGGVDIPESELVLYFCQEPKYVGV